MAMELICGGCGYRQIYLYYSKGAQDLMRRALQHSPDVIPCENCHQTGKLTVKEPRDLVALVHKFPHKKVIRSFKTNEQLLAMNNDWVNSSNPDEVEATR